MLGTILWGIIGGAIVGILGRLLLPGKQDISMVVTIGVGIVAALLGGVLADWLGVGDTKGIDWIRHFLQLVLAMIFVYLAARYMSNRKAGGTTSRR